MKLKKQVVKFSGVGMFVTAIDFGLLNIFRLLGLPIVIANMMSSSLSMILSYRLNKNHVFKKGGTTKRQKALFIGGTLFGLYVIQSFIIHGFDMQRESVLSFVDFVPLVSSYPDIAFTNIAKIVATSVTAVWNFFLYKFVVFRKKPETTT